MPPRTAWRNLLPGLAALIVVVLVTVGVVMFAGIGKIRGDKTHLFVLTDQARGVMRGTEVWIAGQKVGVVDGVEFRPPASDSLGHVVIAISVRRKDAAQIRGDSRAQIRSGLNFIGPVVVSLTDGSPDQAAVQEGDTILGGVQSDFEVAGQKLSAATAELGPLMADARLVIANVKSPNGTVGAFLSSGLGPNVGRLRAQINRLRARFSGPSSRDGQADGEVASPGVLSFTERTRATLARVDSIRSLLGSPTSSLGRFRRDSSLAGSVGRIRDELTELRAELTRVDGTVARIQRDSAITASVARAQSEMALLFADIRRRPMRYVQF